MDVESWTVKKAECRWIDVFELWCWRRLLRLPWTARRSNQSILKEISPEYSLEGQMMKLKLQYSGHLIWRTDSLEKTLMPGKIEGRRRRGRQRMRWLEWHHRLDGHEFEQAPGVCDGQGSLACYSPRGHKESEWATELTWLDTEVKQTGWQYTVLISFPNLEPVCCYMFDSNCCILICIKISQEAGKMVWYSHLSKNFPWFVMIHTIKGFIIYEADFFLEFSCFFKWF